MFGGAVSETTTRPNPRWVASCPEGLKIGAEISFANAIGPFIAIPLHLAARKYYPAQHAKMIVPVLHRGSAGRGQGFF